MAGYEADIFGGYQKPSYDPDVFLNPQKPITLSDQQNKSIGSTVADASNAIGTGYWRGAVRFAGLPVDTVQNVIDLGKAGLGTAYHEVTGKPIPESLQVNLDRSNTVGSSDWLLKQARKSAAGRLMVDPANPAYEGGYLQAAGGSLAGGVVKPQSLPQLVNQVGSSVISSTLGKAAYDATGNPALAVTASFVPTLAQHAIGAGVRQAVRGDEDGRKQMAQRIQDLKNAGVSNPTLGLASGNKVIGSVENLLQSTPGAVGTMKASRDSAIAGIQQKLGDAADAASLSRGSLEAGQAIQNGIRDFRDAFKAKQGALYDQLDQHISPDTPIDVSNTKATLARLNEDIPGAPELSKQFKNARIQSIQDAIQSDTAGSPQTVMVYSRPPVGGGGLMNPPVEQPPVVVSVPAGPSTNKLPFQAVKKTRTLVGNEIADTNLASSVPRSKWNPLYGALADDMQAAANNAGPEAENAYNRANAFSRAGMDRLDRVQPFVNPDAPEPSFQLFNRTLGDNTSTLQALKKSLPESARGTIAATVIDRLGRATPGQQNASSDAWSPETFLTDWNKISPKNRQELFSGFQNADQVAKDVNAAAKATSYMRDSSKMWANPSGTAANLAARLTLWSLPVASLLNPQAAVAAGAGLGSARLTSGLLTNQDLVNAIANPGLLSRTSQRSAIGGLLSNGLLSQQQN